MMGWHPLAGPVIRRLEAERDRLQREFTILTQRNQKLSEEVSGHKHVMASVATVTATDLDRLEKMVSILDASVQRVTAERDEARRECCARTSSEQAIMGFDQRTPQQIAESRGWDCFGEYGK
jgi:hypothetical protein